MRKSTILLSLFALFISIQSFAQVIEANSNMSLGNQNAFKITVEADKGKAEDVWKNYMKDYGKIKKNKKAKELNMMQAVVPALNGSTPCDVYVKFEEGAGRTTVTMWVDVVGAFLNSEDHSERAEGAKTIMREYNFQVQRKVIGEALEDAEKELKKLNKDLEKLQKDNKNLHKEIADAREKIRKAEMNIEKNEVDQAKKQSDIESQSSSVQAIKDKLNAVGKKN